MHSVAVYVDYSYYRKISLSIIKNNAWIIRAVRNFFPAASFNKIPDDQWKVTVYDAKVDLKKHSEFANSSIKLLIDEIANMQRAGMDVKLGDYAVRFTVNGRPAKYKEFSNNPSFQQKGVDSLLIIDAVENVLEHHIEHHIFITGDADFKPLLDYLAQRGVKTAVIHSGAAGDSREFARHASYSCDVKFCTWPQGPVRQKW